MSMDHPYHIDSRGRTAQVDDDGRLTDLIEEVLFTSPGERVNRPTFGCGVNQLVFAGNSPELATATQAMIHGSLQQWLGDLITVEAVVVENDDSTLRIKVQYLPKQGQERQIAQFTKVI